MARGIDAARIATGKPAGGLNVGVVGLGAGSLICFAEPGENWRFYEIDPVVEKIARNPKHFSFMSRCGAKTPVVLGDARLTLKAAPAGGFDYLLIDAFSSDSVPVHLLTREAIELYLSRLAPDGVLALHISNRHMDLQSVAAATVLSIPGVHAAVVSDKKGLGGMDGTKSRVFFIAKSAKSLATVKSWPDAHAAAPKGVRPWTDDYSDVLGAIIRNHWH
ncbi:MAG: fused MFS/spermidine synthase, partial [Hyphomicrobiaceae bacterium]|nr:fused MFS/spermidine synthase [Hyphomicrobiaceae bacterium]